MLNRAPHNKTCPSENSVVTFYSIRRLGVKMTACMQVALPFLHEHELPEAVRFEMQEEESQKASGAYLLSDSPVAVCASELH